VRQQAHVFVESISRRVKNLQRNQRKLQSAAASNKPLSGGPLGKYGRVERAHANVDPDDRNPDGLAARRRARTLRFIHTAMLTGVEVQAQHQFRGATGSDKCDVTAGRRAANDGQRRVGATTLDSEATGRD
jgi:hypothetical protein